MNEPISFKLKISSLKAVISEIKKAYIKNDSTPLIFSEYMGQIILMRGKITTINSLVFMTRDAKIKIPSNIGICVPDEFLKYIDKIKISMAEYIEFELQGNTLYVNIDLESSKVSLNYTVRVLENADSLIPEPKTAEINDIPDKFLTAIKFCGDTVKKSKDVSPGTLVWCTGNAVFSTDEQRKISKVDLESSFTTDFSLSKKAIDLLNSIEVIDSYAIDNRYAFFYSPNQVIGIRQYNFETPKYFLENVVDYSEFHTLRIPHELRDRIAEIAIMNDKKKSPDVEIVESGEWMTINSSASSKKGIKNDIIFQTKSENQMVGELHIGMYLEDLKEIIKKTMKFTINEQETLLNVSVGDFNEFNYYLRLHDKVA